MAPTPRQPSWHPTVAGVVRTGISAVAVAVLCLGLAGLAGVPVSWPLPSPGSVVSAADVRLDKPSPPVRVRVSDAGIDLPVVSSERNVPGNRPGYPLCDVAQYETAYDLPGAPGTTWIFAHAQEGMFLPLFTISEATIGRGLLGSVIELQTKDGRLLRYRIFRVKQRAAVDDWSIGERKGDKGQRLVLQTSTGVGSQPKLQVAASLIGATEATEPAPKPKPRACWQPQQTRNEGRNRPRPTPSAEPVATDGQPMDAMTLVLGSGAVLLGTTIVAVYIVRRQP